MKILLSSIASLLFINLSASATRTQPVQEEVYPYFLDCRDVMVELYGELLFLQPNGSSLCYAAEAIGLDQSINIPAISPNWNILEVNPSYSPAFEVGAKLLFSKTNTNLTANWERLHSSKTVSDQVYLAGEMLGPMFDIGPNSALYSVAEGKATFHFDAANLTFGQQFCALKRWYPNLYAGAAFARIHQILNSSYSNVAASTSRSITSYSNFIGAGPQIGVDFGYRIVKGFFFNGASSLGLIIGQSKNETTFLSDSPYLISQGIPVPNTQTISVPHRTQLVPSFEEKLGFSYLGIFTCCKVKLEVGYQAQIYLNAVQSMEMTAPQVEPSLLSVTVPDSGLFAVGFKRTLSNFILTGPYLSLNIDF